jgi:hypothetical protein
VKTEVGRIVLMDILVENRRQHRVDFEETWIGYKTIVVGKLTDLLYSAQAAEPPNPIPAAIFASPPSDHTEDYDRILGMLEMSSSATIELNEQDYAKYVLDQWDWKPQWETTASAYNSKFGS